MSTQAIATMREIETDRFRVVIDALPEDIPIRDYFDPTVFDVEEKERKVEQGEAVWFTARCRVVHKPSGAELGSDHLGACYYESFDHFLEVNGSGYLPGMVRDSITRARYTIADMQL